MSEERQREEEQKSRVATVAVVVCSAVAILAIVVFLVALFNGVLLNKELEYVKVPDLIGQVYSDYLVQELDDFNIQLRPQQYNDEYDKGKIMSQEPVGSTEVKKGADIWITVSMGPEPETKTMDDYVGARQEGVESALKGQGFVPIFFDEASDKPVGVVIRTEPVAGTELELGQSIRIFVSSGPDLELKKVPDVIGRPQDHAIELLNTAGFANVRPLTEESDEPVGTVIYQSVNPGEEIDVSTEIFLTISAGPAKKEEQAPVAPQPQETQAPAESVTTKSISFALPERETAYTVTVLRDGVPIVSDAPVDPSSQVFTIPNVEGSGSVLFELLVDGVFYSSRTEEF